MEKKYVIGVDVGGTTIKIAIFSISGEIIKKWEIPTVTVDNGQKILPDIIESLKETIRELNLENNLIAGIGVGVPGPVADNAVVKRCVNLNWEEISVKKIIEEGLQLPVVVENDANVAALGEMWKGGGNGASNMVMVTLGTGVGGGIIANGKLVAGYNSAGGEIGHICVEYENGVTCACGNNGCLEQYASAVGIVRLAKFELQSTNYKTVLKNDEELSSKIIFDAAKSGDEFALKITDKVCEYLGKSMAHIACVVNPQVFVLGGGMSKAGQILLDGIEKYYRKYAFHAAKETTFTVATLGNDAGVYGSTKLILSMESA